MSTFCVSKNRQAGDASSIGVDSHISDGITLIERQKPSCSANGKEGGHRESFEKHDGLKKE